MTCSMDEKIKFVGDFLDGRASMSALSEHYGVSRRIGYKWVTRYRDEGVDGLKERPSAPLKLCCLSWNETVPPPCL
jgi:transposase-like protein